MNVLKIVTAHILVLSFFIACASVASEQSGQGTSAPAAGAAAKLNEAAAKSAAAQSRMDQAFSGGAPTTKQTQAKSESAAPAPVPAITKDSTGKPSWVNKSDTVYDKNYYVSAVGMGSSRSQAESNAFGNLTGYFGQTVASNIVSVETYKDMVQNGSIDISASQEASHSVQTSTSMEALVGAEIGDTWNDTKTKTYYAVAIMDKKKCANLYSSLIDANLNLIERLTTLSAAEKSSIDAIIKYQAAAATAEANEVFATVLSLLGGANRKSDLKTNKDYRYDAKILAAAIPINIIVDNDSGGRVKAAFASVFSGAGFRTGNNNSRYVLHVNLKIDPVEYPNNKNKFARYVLDANLTDNQTKSVLFPFNINDREGALTTSEAEVRVYRAAENKIKEEYGIAFKEYLSGLLPQD